MSAKGLGEVPRLASLQPLYIARQLLDNQYRSTLRRVIWVSFPYLMYPQEFAIHKLRVPFSH
jgi:hypothetical protein